MITKILRMEAALVLFGATYWFGLTDYTWWLFAVLLLTPDLFMVGYIKDTRLGAHIYNLGHSYVLPLALLFIGSVRDHNLCIALGAIWAAHIAMDRMLGYGLKLPKGFRHTHLGKIK